MSKIRPEDRELEVGGILDDSDAVIIDAYFGPARAEYAAIAGEDPVLHLVLESPDLEQPVEQQWSCGGAKEWEVTREGKEIVSGTHPDSHRFNMKSLAGRLVTTMCENAGEGNVGKGQDIMFKRDKYMTEAEFYLGWSFHWKNREIEKMPGKVGPILLTTAFLGETKVAAKAAAPAKEVSGELVDKLIALAEGKTARELKQAVVKETDKTAPGYKEFMAELLKPKEGIIEQLVEQGKLTEGPDGRFL